jgi:hypothetical protein
MAVWPSLLPPFNEVQSWVETPSNTIIRTEMAEGPPKVRRNPQPIPAKITMTQLYTKDQTETMDTFYVETLELGSDTFDETHPRTDASLVFRFIDRPTYQYLGGILYRATLNLEVVP